jgi:hypothetical protein
VAVRTAVLILTLRCEREGYDGKMLVSSAMFDTEFDDAARPPSNERLWSCTHGSSRPVSKYDKPCWLRDSAVVGGAYRVAGAVHRPQIDSDPNPHGRLRASSDYCGKTWTGIVQTFPLSLTTWSSKCPA